METQAGRTWIYRLCLALALGFLVFGTIELVSWNADRARLRTLAAAVAAPAHGEVERLTRLTDWLFRNVKPGKNRRYHLWRKLDATPIQILEHGGDCEDKSKLLAVLLRELGIESSLAMLSSCAQCKLTHTVVFIETRAGWTLADPAYGFTFPDRRGSFHTIETLRAEPALLQNRLAELRAARGPDDVINQYHRDRDLYAHMTTFNWNKNALLRGAADLLRAAGAEPWSVPRPLFLDDPKQFFALLGLGGALGFALLALLLRPRRRSAPDGTPRAIVEIRGGGTDAEAHSQS